MLHVSGAGRVLMRDVHQFSEEDVFDGGEGWVDFDDCHRDHTYRTARTLAGHGFVEARKLPGGFEVRLTEQGEAWLETA